MTGYKLKSYGERIIETILTENNINYVSEKSINTGRKRPQRIDFYIELKDKCYAIEYQGEQHFRETTGAWSSKPLEYVKMLDKVKYEYCKRNNIDVLYINYPNLNKKDILLQIEDFLGIKLEYTEGIKDFYIGTEKEKEVIEFYLTHSEKETQEEFDMTKNEVKGLMRRRGIIKRFKRVIGLNIKTLEEVKFDTLKDAQEWLGSSGIRACVIGNRKTCCGYLWRYENDDFSYRAKTITDKRIKVYVAKKGNEVIKLPLQMLFSEYGLPKANVVGCVKGKYKTVKGYTIREATKEEQEETLSSISYIDYIQSFKNP